MGQPDRQLMDENQIQLAEKIRGFMQTLRGGGLIIAGQATFRHVKANTMGPEYDTEIIVTNCDGKYIFDVHTLGTLGLEEWGDLEVSKEEGQADTKAPERNRGEEGTAQVP